MLWRSIRCYNYLLVCLFSVCLFFSLSGQAKATTDYQVISTDTSGYGGGDCVFQTFLNSLPYISGFSYTDSFYNTVEFPIYLYKGILIEGYSVGTFATLIATGTCFSTTSGWGDCYFGKSYQATVDDNYIIGICKDGANVPDPYNSNCSDTYALGAEFYEAFGTVTTYGCDGDLKSRVFYDDTYEPVYTGDYIIYAWPNTTTSIIPNFSSYMFDIKATSTYKNLHLEISTENSSTTYSVTLDTNTLNYGNGSVFRAVFPNPYFNMPNGYYISEVNLYGLSSCQQQSCIDVFIASDNLTFTIDNSLATGTGWQNPDYYATSSATTTPRQQCYNSCGETWYDQIICRTACFLFVPSTILTEMYINMKTDLQTMKPLGYFYLVSDKLTTISTTSTSTINMGSTDFSNFTNIINFFMIALMFIYIFKRLVVVPV